MFHMECLVYGHKLQCIFILSFFGLHSGAFAGTFFRMHIGKKKSQQNSNFLESGNLASQKNQTDMFFVSCQ